MNRPTWILITVFLLTWAAVAGAADRTATAAGLEELRRIVDDTQSNLYLLSGAAPRSLGTDERNTLMVQADQDLIQAMALIDGKGLRLSKEFRTQCRLRLDVIRFHLSMQDFEEGRTQTLNLMQDLKAALCQGRTGRTVRATPTPRSSIPLDITLTVSVSPRCS